MWSTTAAYDSVTNNYFLQLRTIARRKFVLLFEIRHFYPPHLKTRDLWHGSLQEEEAGRTVSLTTPFEPMAFPGFEVEQVVYDGA